MSLETAHGHEHAEVTNTGIDNRKLGFWLFLSSETIFFACLLVGYLVYHGQNGSGPTPAELFEIPLTSISTFVLLMSSLSVVLGVFSAQQGHAKAARGWVAATALMGLVFLGFQAYEFTHFYHEGLTLSSSLFGTTFYVLTGFHGAHVAVGVIWLLSLLFHGRKGGLGQDKAGDVEIAGLYWHFVDIVWIVLFTVVYLLEAAM
ncbi:MAG: cytochrome oxidase subunit [Symbiobacteriaceae bacterium]|jgi:heme/copper-type cytochrome/quinol oxidase subunit 3|nr:cytochrome oxidase subunit [Symbiobacteriaceae bacterium]